MKATEFADPTLREVYLDRVIGGVAVIALHEASTVQGHIEALSERLRLARRARSVRELLRDQVDLLPEERNRVRRNREVRRELWRGLMTDLKVPALRRPS